MSAVRARRLEEELHRFEGDGSKNACKASRPNLQKIKNWKRPEDTLNGYTGFYSRGEEDDILEQPMRKHRIRGYGGFIPRRRDVCGAPSIPSQDEQTEYAERLSRKLETCLAANNVQNEIEHDDEEFGLEDSAAFRTKAKNMDVCERYETAINRLLMRGQSQEMLLRMVQAKISEKVKSYAEQMISLRKLFEAFDINGDGVLDEAEFRLCLERCNIQFDDLQVLALFAYFDGDYQGCIDWERFAENATVFNPKGGTAVLPKQITATFKSSDWNNVGFSARK